MQQFKVQESGTRDQARKDYLDAVSQIGCLACLLRGIPGTLAEIHHPTTGLGRGERADDYYGIPLCRHDHRLNHISVHGSQRRMFFAEFGNEFKLARMTQKYVLDRNSMIVIGKKVTIPDEYRIIHQ